MLTVDLFSVYLLSHVDVVIRYFKVDLTFGLLDYVRYIEEFVISRFVISRFYSIDFAVSLAGAQNSVRYIEDFVNRGSLNRGSTLLDYLQVRRTPTCH